MTSTVDCKHTCMTFGAGIDKGEYQLAKLKFKASPPLPYRPIYTNNIIPFECITSYYLDRPTNHHTRKKTNTDHIDGFQQVLDKFLVQCPLTI